MVDRDFDKIALRLMLERATAFHANVVDGRFAIATRHAGRNWEVIAEPDHDDELLFVTTAYPLD